MPYKNVEEAIKKHPGLKEYSAKAQRGWFKSINKCFEDGGKDDKCFPIAWSVANKVDGKPPKSKKSSLTQPLQTRPDYGHVLTLAEMQADLRGVQANEGGKQDDEKKARFEKGKPADPTQNMSPEDKKKWQEENDKHKDQFKKASPRRARLTTKLAALQKQQEHNAALDEIWAKLNTPPQAKEAAVTPAGLYGYTKTIQQDCETATRKLNKFATQVAKQAYQKDEKVAEFLSTHSKRASSLSAKILIAAMQGIGPKISSDKKACACSGEDTPCTCQHKEAARGDYSLYGYRTKTAQLGLQACSDIRNEAGRIASTLHRRKAALHEKITGFFREHSKMAKCSTSRMILDCYPDATMKLGSVVPRKVEEILSWEG